MYSCNSTPEVIAPKVSSPQLPKVTIVPFEHIPDTAHMAIIIVPDSLLQSERKTIKEFNSEISRPELNVFAIRVFNSEGGTIPILSIGGFETFTDAEDYIKQLRLKEIYPPDKIVFSASYPNYRLLFRQKNWREYIQFYKDNLADLRPSEIK
ncbi:MAG TPA: hypothetical protein ENJ28_12220 [Gammaproteobacteria bacterium]|nr:hypothetical protein [Gammaproteobacteria bacterium]